MRPGTSTTDLFLPCITHLQQNSSHRAPADILTHIHRAHDDPRICIKLGHLIRMCVESWSLTTWMNFHERLVPSLPTTLLTFFSTQRTDADSSVTVSFTMTKDIANRLIRLSISIDWGEYSPTRIVHPFNFFNSTTIFLRT